MKKIALSVLLGLLVACLNVCCGGDSTQTGAADGGDPAGQDSGGSAHEDAGAQGRDAGDAGHPEGDGGPDAAGAGDSGPEGDAGDAGEADAGPPDAGLPDAGAGDAGGIDTGDFDTGPADAGPADGGRLGSEVILLTLDAGAFPPTPAHPSALVYVPDRFDPAPPLHVIVYIHGFHNCVANIINDGGSSCDPDAGTPARNAYNLAGQLEGSGKNALLLCPEVEFDQASGNPGPLGQGGGFKALLAEALDDLSPVLGPRTVADVGELIVASHSGGYQAAAGIAARGGVPVQEIWLFDSLYGSTADIDAWVNEDLAGFAAVRRRFMDVYTSGGGTLANSQAMADRAAAWVGADGGTLVDDRTTSTWTPDIYRHGLLFKLSALAHDGVPRYYFGQLLQTSSLPDR